MPFQRLQFSVVILNLIALLLLCLLALMGCSQSSHPSGQTRGQDGQSKAASELQVRTVSVERISIQRQVDLSGTLVSNEQVKVSSEIAGTVLESNVRLGQEVEAGQILFQLDTRELVLEKDRAESALRQTETQLGIDSSHPTGALDDEIASVRTAIANRDEASQKFAQAQELDRKGLIPRSDMDTTKTRLRVAEAALQLAVENVRSLKASLQDRRAFVQLAQKKINDASIRAPVSGTISERLAQRGEFVRENAQVATIVQLNPLQLNTAVQERLADVIRVNLPVQFAVEPFPGKTFIGRIANISPQIDPTTRTFQVEVFVENPKRELKPGFFAQGVILTRTDHDVMAAPREAVFTLAGVSSVFVIENGIARQQTVTLGAQEGGLSEIVSGLKGNETLAASNLSQIVTGTKIASNSAESPMAARRRELGWEVHDEARRRQHSPLLALSLSTGIVIDDAIVVLENVFRYVEEKGLSPWEAASKATAEIGLAVVATTLSLVVIFLPVVFMTGQIGQYLLAFGIVCASAILLSMFVSFTLTPALCATWLRAKDAGSHDTTSKSKGVYAWIDGMYGRLLLFSLHHRAVMLVIALTVTASAVLLYPRVGIELVPEDDQGEFNVSVNLPTGTSFERTEEYFADLEPTLRDLPAVQTVFSSINPGSASFFVGMSPLAEREPGLLKSLASRLHLVSLDADEYVSQRDLIRRVRTFLRERYPGVRTNVSGGTDLSGSSTAGGSGGGRGSGGSTGGGNRLQMLIQGPDIAQLQAYVDSLMQKLRTVPGITEVDTNFQPTQPELRVIVSRVRAADRGVAIDALASSVRTLVGGELISTLKDGDDQYDVQLRLDTEFRSDPERLGNLLIPASGGRVVRITDIAQLKSDLGPSRIDRYNRQRNITINANLDNLPLGEAVVAAREKIAELDLKPGYQAVFTGSARTLATASNDFTLAIFLAVAFIFMVLASQFNSVLHPVTIMTALPLSLPAGLLALLISGNTLNVYSGIGMLMLFGIVKKNSILQVDYTNTLRDQGMNRLQALITANHVRLRPILMTTVAIIAGMLPIALGRGAGAGSRASMAITIIGGQMLCLLLTLLVTPVVYSCLDDLRGWRTLRPFSWFRPQPVDQPRSAGD